MGGGNLLREPRIVPALEEEARQRERTGKRDPGVKVPQGRLVDPDLQIGQGSLVDPHLKVGEGLVGVARGRFTRSPEPE